MSLRVIYSAWRKHGDRSNTLRHSRAARSRFYRERELVFCSRVPGLTILARNDGLPRVSGTG